MMLWRPVALAVIAIGAGVGAPAGCAKSEPDPASGVLGAYLEAGTLLAADNVAGLAPVAATVGKQAAAQGAEPGMDRVSRGATELAATDLAAARVAFRTVSGGLIANLAADPAKQAGLMAVHCPMTFDNEGAYWVQKAGKVMNPYEGSRMLHCGSKVDWAEALANTKIREPKAQ